MLLFQLNNGSQTGETKFRQGAEGNNNQSTTSSVETEFTIFLIYNKGTKFPAKYVSLSF
jgi:hypothetical protein